MATVSLPRREHLSDGERLGRAQKRVEWAARSLEAAAADLELAGDGRLAGQAGEQARAADVLARHAATRRAKVP